MLSPKVVIEDNKLLRTGLGLIGTFETTTNNNKQQQQQTTTQNQQQHLSNTQPTVFLFVFITVYKKRYFITMHCILCFI